MNPRKILLERMEELESKQMGCASCEGFCCTYQANSMQITPLETYEMLQSLGELSAELKQRLKENIKEFRLDKEIFISRNKTMRRTYTCPFFKHEALGCSINPAAKPYGCLAFNAGERNVSEFGKCASDEGLLEEVQALVGDANEVFKQKYGVSWTKKPIPLALIELEEYLSRLE